MPNTLLLLLYPRQLIAYRYSLEVLPLAAPGLVPWSTGHPALVFFSPGRRPVLSSSSSPRTRLERRGRKAYSTAVLQLLSYCDDDYGKGSKQPFYYSLFLTIDRGIVVRSDCTTTLASYSPLSRYLKHVRAPLLSCCV